MKEKGCILDAKNAKNAKMQKILLDLDQPPLAFLKANLICLQMDEEAEEEEERDAEFRRRNKSAMMAVANKMAAPVRDPATMYASLLCMCGKEREIMIFIL